MLGAKQLVNCRLPLFQSALPSIATAREIFLTISSSKEAAVPNASGNTVARGKPGSPSAHSPCMHSEFQVNWLTLSLGIAGDRDETIKSYSSGVDAATSSSTRFAIGKLVLYQGNAALLNGWWRVSAASARCMHMAHSFIAASIDILNILTCTAGRWLLIKP